MQLSAEQHRLRFKHYLSSLQVTDSFISFMTSSAALCMIYNYSSDIVVRNVAHIFDKVSVWYRILSPINLQYTLLSVHRACYCSLGMI